MYDFTVADVAMEVRRLAAESPEFIYEGEVGAIGCSYVSGRNGKGCLVGQALTNLGVEREDLVKHEGDTASSLLRCLGLVGSEGEDWPYNPDLIFVQTAQGRQDVGDSWRVAVVEAERAAAEQAAYNERAKGNE